jgi:hypothetical protein
MRIQHGDNCVSEMKVGQWIETCEENRTGVVDEEYFVPPVTVTWVRIG